MANLNYPDHFYADALAPKKPSGAYDAAKLREDTIAIAVSQDRDNDALPSILAEMRSVVARLERYAERKPIQSAACKDANQPVDCAGYDAALRSISEAIQPSADGLQTRIIKDNPQPEHLAWHVTGDPTDLSVERDSPESRL